MTPSGIGNERGKGFVAAQGNDADNYEDKHVQSPGSDPTRRRAAPTLRAAKQTRPRPHARRICEQHDHDRKHAIKLLGDARPKPKGSPPPGPAPKYQLIAEPLGHIWQHAEQLCGKRRAPALALWLPHYHKHFNPLLSSADQRLLAGGELGRKARQTLRDQQASRDPFALAKELNPRLKKILH